MNGFLLRSLLLAVLAVSLALQNSGLFVDTLGALLLAAVMLGVANGGLRTFFCKRNWSLGWLRLGFAAAAINLSLWGTAMLVLPGFRIDNIVQACGALLLLSFFSAALSRILQDR